MASAGNETTPPPLTYIYKLVPTTFPISDPLPDTLDLSDLDATSGFIHLSKASQLQGTLRHFFAESTEIYVLRLDYEQVRAQVRWETPDASVCGPREDEGMFPHLYNGTPPRLGRVEVEGFKLLRRQGDLWDLKIISEAKGWIIDV
ncbi:hypothetical protein BKA62DRAFT_657116 [Auriculariales sp. MPI-PUGE-AT-0066]|nr:hypothetical protein BKA62DRAFT_657116 [Auriculariales sp. MPI-PUGE-AT-0066]